MTDLAQGRVDQEVGDLPAPPRIKTLTLCNFRGFPGPAPIPVDFDGRNAVIFGENGSGKSSIFQALDGFFSVAEFSSTARRERLRRAVNLFSGLGFDDTYVEVEFDDGDTERWSSLRHPCDVARGSERNSSRVFQAAYRQAIFDYRLLLETNFRHTAGSINLFDVCVAGVLRDFQVPFEGSERAIRDLWNDLQVYIKPPPRSWADPARREILLGGFNAGLSAALNGLVTTINEMLVEMNWGDVVLEGFSFPSLTYNHEWPLKLRGFRGAQIEPVLQFNGQRLSHPHLFLNEARLSALAIAIYLAGRKLCGATTLADTPRIMVLDDVVIGLDQSNRLPVMDLLAKHFSGWQVVILTHDRFWFDMIRTYHRRHKADKYWDYWELHPGEGEIDPPTPLRISSSSARQAIDLATSFLNKGHINAAGNAVRIASERALREFCEAKKVPVKYKADGEKIPFSDLLEGAKEWSNHRANGTYNEALADVELYASAMLNRLSHGGTTSLTKHEVQGGIVAMRGLLTSLKVVSIHDTKLSAPR